MGDSKWNERLTPIFKRAVTHLSGDLAPLLDSLLSKGLLSTKQYSKMIQNLKDGAKDEDVARELLLGLVERPSPSFDNFVSVLEEYVENHPGSSCDHLLQLLNDAESFKLPLELLKDMDFDQPGEETKTSDSSDDDLDSGDLEATSHPPLLEQIGACCETKTNDSSDDNSESKDLERALLLKQVRAYSRTLVPMWRPLMRQMNAPGGSLASVANRYPALLRKDLPEIADNTFPSSNGQLEALEFTQMYFREMMYREALASGSVPVNRYRLIVVGKDGAGKSSLIDSLLNRPFKQKNPSTKGIAIEMAVAEGGPDGGAWTAGEDCEKGQHLDKYVAARCAITVKNARVADQGNQMETTETMQEQVQPKAASRERSSWGGPTAEATKYDKEDDLFVSDESVEEGKPLIKEKLTKEQQKHFSHFIESDKALERLQNSEVDMKLVWDLGGQERYLTTHAALLPTESPYTVCQYLLAVDLSKPLCEEAKSFFRLGEGREDQPIKLYSLRSNSDFLRHWLSAICIAHPTSTPPPYLGENLGVEYPAVLIAGTHMDLVQGMEKASEFLQLQNNELDKIIRNLKAEQHVCEPEEDGLTNLDSTLARTKYFPVDNTKSGKGNESRCEGVKAIQRTLDASSKQYWLKMNQARPMPVTWLLFEIRLVTTKRKIINKDEAMKLARKSKIGSSAKALVALKFLHGLGVIFYFWEVKSLSDRIIVDPKWLIDSVAAVVSVNEPKQPKLRPPWRMLCGEGKTSMTLISGLLSEANVKESDEKTVVEVLKLLDVICESQEETSAEEVLIPCMATKELEDVKIWQKYDPSGPFPPPVVIFPERVPAIPSALFFRLVTRLARQYPKGCKLSQDRCIFRLANNLVLELLHHDLGRCIIASLNAENEEDEDEAIGQVALKASEVQRFLLSNVEDAKRRGMSGLEMKKYYQVGKCVYHSVKGEGEEDLTTARLPDDDYLVEHCDDCSPTASNPVVEYKSKRRGVSTKHRKKVHLWYEKSRAIIRSEENVKETEAKGCSDTARAEESVAEMLKRKPTDTELLELSKRIVSEWTRVAIRLGLRSYEYEVIKINNQDVANQALEMLTKWRMEKAASASVLTLCVALKQEDLNEIIDEVFHFDVMKQLEFF